jgi:hypothetical protein
MRDTAGKAPNCLQPRRFFQLRLAPPPCRDIEHTEQGPRFTAQGTAMHLNRRIGGLIGRREPGFNRGRRGRAGKGDGDDLAHRFLARFRKKQCRIAPRPWRRAIGAKPLKHGTCGANSSFRIQYGQSRLFLGFEKPTEGISRSFYPATHAAAPARPRRRQT